MWYPKMHQCRCLVCTRSECAIVAYMECAVPIGTVVYRKCVQVERVWRARLLLVTS